MISKTINSTITTLINPFDVSGLLSRYFVTLDPVLNSHYEVAAPITFAGDFEIEVEFSKGPQESDYNVLIGQSNTTSNWITTRTNYVSISMGAAVLNGVIPILDGKLHLIKLTRVGSLISLYVDGVADGTMNKTNNIVFDQIGRNTGSHFFDGILANVKFTDQSGASDVVTTFKLDQATANTESSVEGNNSVTYVNTPQSARDLYTLEGSTWTDAAGNTIEVAS